MAEPIARSKSQLHPGGYVVRRPRATDAIAQSLHAVYRPGGDTPADVRALLAQLDRIAAR